eukprot:7258310-Lingulodinium_polyedra.AAC.1
MQPGALRASFEQAVPLGNLQGLPYFAMLASALREALRRRGSGCLEGLAGLSATYIEQAAIDGGRHQ